MENKEGLNDVWEMKNPLNAPPHFVKVLEWNEVDLGQSS